MYKRHQFNILRERLLEQRHTIQVLSGPRQVGKSTLVKQVAQELPLPYMFVSADNINSTENSWISDTWQSARMQVKLNKYSEFLLIIDEVHKVDNWSEAVKKEWDYDTFYDVNIKVVLLGSSRLLLKYGLTESLAGRFEIIHMPHWSYQEMHDAFGFSIEEYVYFGGYPGGAFLKSDNQRWRKYIKESIISPAIEKDVIQTTNIYKTTLMTQLFELGCLYSGEELSLNKVVGQLQDVGNVTTASNYLKILDESRLLCGLQKYASDNARKYNSVPKFMVYNTALLSALSGADFKTVAVDSKQWGRWVESSVGAHLVNMAEACGYKVYYWRERNDEVDFILESNRKTVAIEVKSGSNLDNTGLKVFGEKFKPNYSLVVGPYAPVKLEEFFAWNLEELFL